jgi:hypothetical protein
MTGLIRRRGKSLEFYLIDMFLMFAILSVEVKIGQIGKRGKIENKS